MFNDTQGSAPFLFKEQAMRGGGAGGGGGGGLGGGKNYDSVSNSDRDGYGQPDGKLIFLILFFFFFVNYAFIEFEFFKTSSL